MIPPTNHDSSEVTTWGHDFCLPQLIGAKTAPPVTTGVTLQVAMKTQIFADKILSPIQSHYTHLG